MRGRWLEKLGGAGWAGAFRSAPMGVLIVGALLFFVGAGLLLGGVYLTFAGDVEQRAMCLLGSVAGGLILYVALSLVQRKRWSWLVSVVLLLLLLATSVFRAFASLPAFPLLPLAEILFEVGGLAYFWRRSVRDAFR